jgi:hypothetical protein
MATTMSRPAPPALDTPASATFPSELKSSLPTSLPVNVKHEEPQKTPITPPAAYLDFLAKRSSRNFSPPSSATFNPVLLEKPSLTSFPSTDSVATEATVQTLSTESDGTTAESAAPEPPARVDSPDSQASVQSSNSATSQEPVAGPSNSKAMARIDTSARPRRISTGPISPFGALPDSARTPRRLCIPQSPYSPRVQSPLTPGGAVGLVSPITTTIMSPVGTSLYSPYSTALSPKDNLDSPRSQLTLKQVMTRTVTIARPPAPIMEPVPASKKRKIEGPTSPS